MKRLLFTLSVVVFSTCYLHAQVAVNDDGTSPDNSAMLDVKSVDKGLLIPRLSTTARNTLAATAVAGLMVYDTDLNKFFFFNGVAWDEGSTGSLWLKNSSYTYLSPSSSNLGIGTKIPQHDLDIVDSTSSAFLKIRSLASYAGIYIEKDAATDNSYIVWGTGGTNHWFTGLIDNNDYAISKTFNSADGTFYIESGGDVGIGTASPDANLEVADASGEVELRITRPSSSFASLLTFNTLADEEWSFLIPSASDDMLISRGGGNTTGNLGLMSSGGNVGIGTNSPARPLEVKGPFQTARISSTTSGGTTLEFVSASQNDWAVGIWNGSFILLNSTDDFASKTDEYYFTTTSIYPWVNNVKTLGTTSKRWSNFYSYDGDFSDDVTVGDVLTVLGTASIGTATQQGKLHVHDDTPFASIYVTPDATNDSSAIFLCEDPGGTLGMYWEYDGGSNEMQLGSLVSGTISGPHISVARGTGNVAIGGAYATGYKLSVDGKIMCEELRVDLSTGWPDYVFGKD